MKPAPRHEELRKQYEAEAAQNPKAYELHWQYRNHIHGVWCSCDSRPMWYENVDYRRKPQGHPHAELMAQYAEDAKTHERPWELWEGLEEGYTWRQLYQQLQWRADVQYRRKPEPAKVEQTQPYTITCTKVEQTQPYTITCTMVINAANSDEAAWQFRELLASGVQPVLWVDDCGINGHKSGVRPRGQ